jgi:hypothetical protein
VAVKRINFRDSQLQARLGLIIACASVANALLVFLMIWGTRNPVGKTIAYNPESWRRPAIWGATGVACILGMFGFGLGYSSLGHKRNVRQRESWLGVVLGSLGVCLAIILLMFFQWYTLPIVPAVK